MTRMTVVTMGLLVVGLTVLGGAYLTFGQSDAGWTTLIDGAKDLENWDRLGDANWRVEDGAIVADKGKGGGLFIRCTDPKAITATNAYEVNIYDQRPEPIYGTGAIVNIAKVEPMPKAGGKWNTYEITAKGAQLTVVLNDVKTADVLDSKHAQGPFALQFGNRANEAPGGAIKWRKVQIKSL
jgi:3-keto-disaccharide hydrolase